MSDEDRYREAMGREPPGPIDPEDPLAWQWKYRGTKEERERLGDELVEDDRGEQPEQDEALF